MLIKGSNQIKANRKKVWKYLLDPKALKKAIPGLKQLSLEDGVYYAEIELGFAFLRGNYSGEFRIHEDKEPELMQIDLTGSSKNNSISTTGSLLLEKNKTGTKVSYKTKPKISGRIAFMGNRLFNNIAQNIAGQFFSNIEKQILEAESLKKKKKGEIKKAKKIKAKNKNKSKKKKGVKKGERNLKKGKKS